MAVRREVIESPMPQGVDEIISYTLNTTPWGGAPSSPECVVYDITDRERTDVTEEVMPVNNPAVDSEDENVIILSPLQSLEDGKKYRVEVKWTTSGNALETYCIIKGEL